MSFQTRMAPERIDRHAVRLLGGGGRMVERLAE